MGSLDGASRLDLGPEREAAKGLCEKFGQARKSALSTRRFLVSKTQIRLTLYRTKPATFVRVDYGSSLKIISK